MTTKELADRLTAECADDIYNQTVFAHLEDRDKSTVKECINESIPLLELLEVARAADKCIRAVGYVEQINRENIMIDAMIALRTKLPEL